jgi:pyruvate dehydrogenase E1 component alpha subunit
MDPPAFEDFFDRPYAEPHSLVEEERAWYAAYQAGFDDTDTHTDDDAGPGTAGPDRGTQAAGLTVAADPDRPAEGTLSGTEEDLA